MKYIIHDNIQAMYALLLGCKLETYHARISVGMKEIAHAIIMDYDLPYVVTDDTKSLLERENYDKVVDNALSTTVVVKDQTHYVLPRFTIEDISEN